MKRALALLPLLVLCPLASPLASAAADGDRLRNLGFLVQEGVVAAPDFTTEDAAGNRVSSRSFRGRVVLLNFWATWCPPCRLEMPSMERLYGEFRERGLEVVAVNFMEPRELVQAFARERKLTYPMLLDPRSDVAEMYGVMRLPETVVIGRGGEVIAKTTGYKDWYKEDVRELVSALLEDRQPARPAPREAPAPPPEQPSQGVWRYLAAVAVVLLAAALAAFRLRRRGVRGSMG